ncbi:MAG: hypothetical protein M1820_010127 [Bogoriella megaspora]|nr:MAG: hypothetical protein M1820_010127 [Bogoriella megaspora]
MPVQLVTDILQDTRTLSMKIERLELSRESTIADLAELAPAFVSFTTKIAADANNTYSAVRNTATALKNTSTNKCTSIRGNWLKIPDHLQQERNNLDRATSVPGQIRTLLTNFCQHLEKQLLQGKLETKYNGWIRGQNHDNLQQTHVRLRTSLNLIRNTLFPALEQVEDSLTAELVRVELWQAVFPSQ